MKSFWDLLAEKVQREEVALLRERQREAIEDDQARRQAAAQRRVEEFIRMWRSLVRWGWWRPGQED